MSREPATSSTRPAAATSGGARFRRRALRHSKPATRRAAVAAEVPANRTDRLGGHIMRRTAIAAATGLLLLAYGTCATALDADDLSALVGYTIVAATNVDGEFEGAEFGKLVKLENGMMF